MTALPLPSQEDLSAILRGTPFTKGSPLEQTVKDLVNQYGPAAVISEALKLHNSNRARARAELERVERIDKELREISGYSLTPKPIYASDLGPATSS